MAIEFDSTYTQYQLSRSPLRRIVRRAYLRRAASMVSGRTLDFGCGVGELLRLLPAGSRGVEYNLATVEYCRKQGLPVEPYNGFTDDWSLSGLLQGDRFESIVISHVLEHLEAPVDVLKKLLVAASRHGVEQVLVIVPGKAGFKVDPTHLTFVDRKMLCDPSIPAVTGFHCVEATYFPGDIRFIGDWFAYHELQVVFRRSVEASVP